MEKLKSEFIGYIEELENLLKDCQFISDIQDTNFLKEYFGNNEELTQFDAFFVKIENCEYIKIYGIEGIVPYNNKMVFEIL